MEEYAPLYLEQIDKHCSEGFCASARQYLPLILKHLGKFRLREFRPLIFQDFIDMVKTITHIEKKISAKPCLKELKKANDFTYQSLAEAAQISPTTVKYAVMGENVSEILAGKIATALQKDITEVFNVKTTEKRYSLETQSKMVGTLKHMFSIAKRLQFIEINYCTADYVRGISLEGTTERPIMDLDETLDALDCLANEKDIRAAISTMLGIFLGKRRCEVSAYQWDNFDLEEGIITTVRSRTVVAGVGVVEKEPKTKNSKNTLYMPDTLTLQLRKYKAWWDDYVVNVLGDRYKGTPYLFLQDKGTAVHPATILYWWKRLQKKYGLKSVDFHSLRKTNISVQYASNLIPSITIAGRAGHGDDKVTKRRYNKRLPSDDKRTAQIVDTLFKRYSTDTTITQANTTTQPNLC